MFPIRQAASKLLPVVSAVGRLVETASRRIVGIANRPRGTTGSPQVGVNRLGVGRIEGEVNRPRVFIFVEDLLEALSAIGRPEDAAFGVRTVRVSEYGNENTIRITRIDEDRSDLLAVP